MTTTRNNHILRLDGNLLGKDYIIGDVHGALDVFNNLFIQLAINPDDRLFIVGDLIDRGEDNAGVLEKIIEINFARSTLSLPPQIYVTRGNHEDAYLKYVNSNNLESRWLQKFLDNGGEWATKLSSENKKRYQDYIESLPYIIFVDGNNPFYIAHADLPLSDAEIFHRLENNNLTLESDDIFYITFARRFRDGEQGKHDIKIDNSARSSNSYPVYCGHSILDGARPETNHFNLDIGAYAYHALCVVDHHDQMCFLVYGTKQTPYYPSIATSQQIIVTEINRIFSLQGETLTIDVEEDPYLLAAESIDQLVDEFKAKFFDYYTIENLKEHAVHQIIEEKFANIRESEDFDSLDELELSVKIIEEIIFAKSRNIVFSPRIASNLFQQFTAPELFVSDLNTNQNNYHDQRMLAIILKKIYEKYLLKDQEILANTPARQSWVEALKELQEKDYDFKSKLYDIVENHPDLFRKKRAKTQDP